LAELGEAGEGVEEGLALDRGYQRQGANFLSTTKTQRKALSKKELSNKPTYLRINNKRPKLNLAMSTSSKS
jgi:hypothetical protein